MFGRKEKERSVFGRREKEVNESGFSFHLRKIVSIHSGRKEKEIDMR